MRKTALSICLAGVLAAPLTASAQATVDFRINLPLVLPQLVVVSPGVEVVPDVDYEVFHVDGWYWVRHQDGWYRSRSHRGGWVAVPVRGVPPGLMRIPPGQYRKWHPVRGPANHERGEWRGDDRERFRMRERERHEDFDDRGRGGGGWKGKKHGKHGRNDD